MTKHKAVLFTLIKLNWTSGLNHLMPSFLLVGCVAVLAGFFLWSLLLNIIITAFVCRLDLTHSIGQWWGFDPCFSNDLLGVCLDPVWWRHPSYAVMHEDALCKRFCWWFLVKLTQRWQKMTSRHSLVPHVSRSSSVHALVRSRTDFCTTKEKKEKKSSINTALSV